MWLLVETIRSLQQKPKPITTTTTKYTTLLSSFAIWNDEWAESVYYVWNIVELTEASTYWLYFHRKLDDYHLIWLYFGFILVALMLEASTRPDLLRRIFILWKAQTMMTDDDDAKKIRQSQWKQWEQWRRSAGRKKEPIRKMNGMRRVAEKGQLKTREGRSRREEVTSKAKYHKRHTQKSMPG